MFHLSSIIILIQIPIVISIITIGFHAINIFKAREFYFINIGWIINLVYLIATFLSNKFHIFHAWEPITNAVSDLLYTYFFLLGTMKSLPQKPFPKLARLPKYYLVTLFITCALFKSLPFFFKFPAFFINYTALPAAILDMFVIYSLALFFKKMSRGYPQSRYLFWSTLSYSGIQLLSMISLPMRNFSSGETFFIANVDTLGFGLGLLSKFMILIGLTTLLIRIVKDYTVVDERLIMQTSFTNKLNRIIGRIFHEITPQLLDMETSISTLNQGQEDKNSDIHFSKRTKREIDRMELTVRRMKTIFTASQRMYKSDVASLDIKDETPNLPIPIDDETDIHNINTIIEVAIMNFKSYILPPDSHVSEKVDFYTEYGGNCNIYCNSVQMVQVFFNLFKNSYEALSEENEGCRIFVKSKNIMIENGDNGSPEKNICIEIEDNGPGIPEQLHEKVFIDGFSTKKLALRTRGFGLDIAKSYTEINSGKIEIKSPVIDFYMSNTNGKPGTRFILYFPKVNVN